MNGNGQRAPREILAEIGRTRGDMDATLNALERRLTPGQLVDQGIDYLKSSGVKEFAGNLGGSMRDNPLPVALVGIGLAWLMATGRNGASGAGATTEDLQGTAQDLKGKGEQAMQDAKGRIGSMAQQARDKLHATQDRAGSIAQSTRDTAAQVGRTARQTMDKAKGSYDYLLREQPLALGVIGLALGALVAAAAPRTEEEDRLMGEASDRLADKATQAGTEQLQKAKDKMPASAQPMAASAQEKQDRKEEVLPAPTGAKVG